MTNPDQMSVTIPVTFTIPTDLWAAHYDRPTATPDDLAAIRADFAQAIANGIACGGITEGIATAWPMMAGRITAGQPEDLLAAVNWTDEFAAAAVTALHATDRDGWALRQALAHVDDADHAEQVLAIVRRVVAAREEADEIVGVVFHTMHHDNGDFLHDHAEVVYLDGTTDGVDFDGVDEHFTEIYGRVAEDAGLAIIVATGEEEYDEGGSSDSRLYAWIASKVPATAGQTTA